MARIRARGRAQSPRPAEQAPQTTQGGKKSASDRFSESFVETGSGHSKDGALQQTHRAVTSHFAITVEEKIAQCRRSIFGAKDPVCVEVEQLHHKYGTAETTAELPPGQELLEGDDATRREKRAEKRARLRSEHHQQDVRHYSSLMAMLQLGEHSGGGQRLHRGDRKTSPDLHAQAQDAEDVGWSENSFYPPILHSYTHPLYSRPVQKGLCRGKTVSANFIDGVV